MQLTLNTKKDFTKVERIGESTWQIPSGKTPIKQQQQESLYNRILKQRGLRHQKKKKSKYQKAVKIGDMISIKELSERLGKPGNRIIKKFCC